MHSFFFFSYRSSLSSPLHLNSNIHTNPILTLIKHLILYTTFVSDLLLLPLFNAINFAASASSNHNNTKKYKTIKFTNANCANNSSSASNEEDLHHISTPEDSMLWWDISQYLLYFLIFPYRSWIAHSSHLHRFA